VSDEKKSRFPMKFSECPGCGCGETITEVAWAEEAEKGRVTAGTPVGALHPQVPLVDPAKTKLIIGGKTGVLVLNIDFCAECGMGWCKEASLTDADLRMAPPTAGPGSPGFGRG